MVSRLGLARILEELEQKAGQGMPEAVALSPAIYTSEDVRALEDRLIFSRDWACPGLAAEIPEAGDYLTFSIADQPIYCIRGKDGEVRSFANVCRHRMMQLLDGRGHCGRVVCPYHAWTYGLDGRLIGAPHMEHSEAFVKSKIRLPEIRTEIWQGWIYVTLNPDAAPVAELLAPLARIVDRYRMADYVPMLHEEHVWETNWKLLTENFMEGYHLPVAHKNTVGAWFPVDDTVFPKKVFDAFTYQTFSKSSDAKFGRAHHKNKRLRGRWRYTSVMPTVFPAHMYVLAPDHLWYLTLRPEGVGNVRVRFGAAIAPEVLVDLEDREVFLLETSNFFEHVNGEDRFVVEGIYKGARAPMTEPGPLSWLEREIHDFRRYLARRLCDSKPAALSSEAAE